MRWAFSDMGFREPAFGLFLALGLLGSWGASATESPVSPPIKEWQKTLDGMEARLQAHDVSDEELQDLRLKAQKIRDELGPARSAAEDHAELVRRDLNALGPAPGAGEAPEAPGLRSKRQHLMDLVALAEASGKETELTRSRLDRVVESIKARRRERFTEEVMTRVTSPLNPMLWIRAFPDWMSLIASGLDGVQGFVTTLSTGSKVLMVGGAIIWLLVWHRFRSYLLKAHLQGPVSGVDPGLYAALRAILFDVLLVGGWVGIGGFTLLMMEGGGSKILPEVLQPVGLILLTILIQRFFKRVLEPEAQFIEMDPVKAARLGGVVTALTLLFALEEGVDALIAGQNASLEVTITNHVIFSLLAAGILVFLIRSYQRGVIRVMTFALILGISVSALTGFVALARLLATRGVLSLVLLVGTRVFFRIVDALSRLVLAPGPGLGASLRTRLQFSEEDAEILVFWLGVVLKALLILSGFLAFLLLWSLDRKDLLIWIADSFQGFHVGSLSLSPAAILTGLSLFIVLLGMTRFLQRVLEEKIFPKTRLDSGIRHSVRSGFGYLGFGLSSMLAISVMGVDLSNLAIVAGALSVGIGFGLQNIVNNFVSGLILLIERPIKAGDWVVVDGHQGLVKKISVRATQISTFDRTTVYIPNSSLISGAVQNKTNPDRVGRIVLPVLIDQDQDLESVQELLIQMATTLPDVRKHPAPAVFVTGLSDSNVHLEWVVFVQDVESIQKVTSQLYKALLKAFKAETIRRKPQKAQELQVRLLNPPTGEGLRQTDWIDNE